MPVARRSTDDAGAPHSDEGAKLSGETIGVSTPEPGDESVDDIQLIASLRGGDLEAYEELWRRHIGPALRLARRLAPQRPEDLTAEAFTTVLHQIAVAGGGPDENFRAYLFTVMRNLAIRWNREDRRLLPLIEADDAVIDDGSERVIGDEDAQIVLRAFRTLPVRWQQVLWLAEVEDEPRSAIAARFTMSPNSVSALLRRARQGLRHQCLVEHVPADLRADLSHVARVLPDLVVGKLPPDTVVKVAAHLTVCATCREVHGDLRGLSRRVKQATLGTLGFGALTTLVLNDVGAATVAAASGLVGTAGGLAVGGPVSSALKVAAVAVGVAAVVVPVTSSINRFPEPQAPPAVAAMPAARTPAMIGSPSDAGAPVPTAAAPAAAQLEVINLWHPAAGAAPVTPAQAVPTPIDPATLPGPAPAAAPAPADASPTAGSSGSGTSSTAGPSGSTTPLTTAGPSASSTPLTTGPSASTTPGGAVPSGSSPSPTARPSASSTTTPATQVPLTQPTAPVVAAVGTSAGYIAPRLSGTVEPLATVGIQVAQTGSAATAGAQAVATATYAVTASTGGAWSFDLSSLGLPGGGYQATVWQVVGATSSQATVVGFSMTALQVDGLPAEATLDNVTAELDGLVITIVAPGQQQACLSSNTGQGATIPLAADGTASRRIRFQGLGVFELAIAICQDDRHGAPVRSTILIIEQIASPWIEYPEPAILIEEL